ncbi:MAG: hypothetical protein K6G26_05780 [Lachnospiraceae bacterium]|nr:hypothetical protein [Lachnospiraceae bacterium]
MNHDFYDELRNFLQNSRSMTDDEISSNYPNLNISFVFDENNYAYLPSIKSGELGYAKKNRDINI